MSKNLRIGFDIDGVIAEFSTAHYKTLLTRKKIERYYNGMKLRFNPYHFLARGDRGFVITGRNSDFTKVTKTWLKRHKIKLPLYILSPLIEYQDFSKKAWMLMGEEKIKWVNKLKLDIYFDDSPRNVMLLREFCPKTLIVKVN